MGSSSSVSKQSQVSLFELGVGSNSTVYNEANEETKRSGGDNEKDEGKKGWEMERERKSELTVVLAVPSDSQSSRLDPKEGPSNGFPEAR